ncbi:adhesion G-protein coupled receptor G4 isoform X2 [Nothobranchius furzeri]|uniref:adhesion G-protein coupled receptor G4 isoform X2 n=1 Tax=Nothobranchius furzeri TaxID=105023 RepID=UPI00390491DC
MIFLKVILNVFVTLLLLTSPASAEERVPWQSLWGKVANFSSGCSHWRLKPQVSIPALQEFTVCLSVKLEAQTSSQWTFFMYRHPEAQYAELGLGGKWGKLVVWLFGEEWLSSQMDLQLFQWYSVCVSWSHRNDRPALYINGDQINLTSAYNTNTPFISPLIWKLSPNGSLTLGAGHIITNGNIKILPFTTLLGKLSLFRIWSRERSKEEVTSLNCTEGDLVKWEKAHWDMSYCGPLIDTSLKCEWSKYEINLMFAIIDHDGTTEDYTARDIAHYWLRTVLPSSVYLPRVSVFEIYRSSTENHIKTSSKDMMMRWAPENITRFHCLAHVNIIPKKDVAAAQNDMYKYLNSPYNSPSGQLQLLLDNTSIQTTPLENFFPTTTSPPTLTTGSIPVKTTTSGSSPSTTLKITTSVMVFPSKATDVPFTTSPATTSDELYFEVKVNVSITGNCNPQQILPIWLNTSLPSGLVVLDLQLLLKVQRRQRDLLLYNSASNKGSAVSISRESFIFQVQVLMPLSDMEIEKKIRQHLLKPFDYESVSIATEDIQISRILIFRCNGDTQHTLKGQFRWPDTLGGKNATLTCPKNPSSSATRHCKLCGSTNWMDPDLEDCSPLVETIPDLDHVDVTPDNALGVVETIEDLLRNHSTLLYDELVTVLNKLKDIINVSVVTPNLGQALINIISDILESDSNLAPFTNTILNITESVGDSMVGYEGSSTLVAETVAISVVDVHPGEFDSLSFGVLTDRTGAKPEIFINKYPFNGTVAFISLPAVLQQNFPEHGQNPPRIQFQFYGNSLLFKGSRPGQILNTFVVSASVTNASSPITDLSEEIKVTLLHLCPNMLGKEVECVYWNFNKNNGHGGWDNHGCREYNSSSDYTTCVCDHLTHFGVLLDVSRTQVDPVHEQILTIVTYVGCGVSSLFLGITVLTYTAFEKLRRDYPSQILIHLSLALLGLNLVFLVNSWLSSWGVYGLCVAVASTLHYFLLASFTWMGLEAVNMYFALIKVFNVYVPSYILKFCFLGWGIPLVICVMVLIVNREAYGGHHYTHARSTFQPLDNSDSFCWLQDDLTFYVSVVAFAALIFLFNIGIFVVVLIQIRHMRVNSPAGTQRGLLQDLKGAASLTFLLGLTWTVGFFTWGPARIVLLYLFSILNTLQGLFVFLFHCLMRENVRRQWRTHLCFGRYRLDEHSEWSNSASMGALPKPKEKAPRAAIPSVRSVKSNSTESTSASSDSSRRDSSCRRPYLGLFVNSLVLPRAQKGPSDAGCLPSFRPTNPTPG